MRLSLDRSMVNAAARYAPELGLLYLNNPKVACSTIKTSLWKAVDAQRGVTTYAGDPHSRPADPFVKNLFARANYDVQKLRSTKIFSVVRNPFVRILSAYLDKIGRDPWIWKPFATRFGIREEVTRDDLTFRDFLMIIAGEQDELLDVHFRPQYLNLLYPICEPHFVGRMENMSEVTEFLRGSEIEVQDHRYHATQSRERLSRYYDDETVSLVRNKFADDFQLFGYSTEIGSTNDFVPSGPGTGGALVQWVSKNILPVDLFDKNSLAFERFSASANKEERMEIARKALELEDNWQRLRAYSVHAVETGEYHLARRIIDRVIELTSKHLDVVRNKSIFVPTALTHS